MSVRVAGVISAHNQVRYIGEAARSLAAEVDELVVVDDGSQDGTYELLQGLEAEGVLRLIRHEEPHGVSEAFNAAVDAVEAEVIFIQGGDDRTLPGRREASLEALARPHALLAYSLPVVIDEEGRELPADAAGEFAAGASLDDPLRYLVDVGNFICAPSVALRAADYRASGGFPPGIDLLQDFALWLELAARGALVRTDVPVVAYRKHATNLSREYVGVDTPRRRRYAAEIEWILDGFLSRADMDALQRLSDLPDEAGLDRDEAAMLVRLGHRDRKVLRRGVSELMTRVAREGSVVLERYGLDRKAVDDLVLRADHDSLSELGRARAAVRALTELGAGRIPADD
ncbi:MAG: glycosyltransferase [Protaetiibacter sp.]